MRREYRILCTVFTLLGKKWIHYTDHPMVTINPKQFHQDPTGIYLFDPDFEPISYWKNKRYKFTVVLKPGSKILELAKLSELEIKKLLLAIIGTTDEYDYQNEQYPTTSINEKIDRMWSVMVPHFYTSRSLWNKKFRSLGFDAIYDSTGAIHTSEKKQLLVLNPSVIKVINMQERKKGAFTEMLLVMNAVAQVLQKYGSVVVQNPKKKEDYWTREKELSGSVRLEKGNNHFEYKFNWNQKYNTINGHVSSRPQLGYGAGITYNISDAKYEFSGLQNIEKDITSWLGKIQEIK